LIRSPNWVSHETAKTQESQPLFDSFRRVKDIETAHSSKPAPAIMKRLGSPMTEAGVNLACSGIHPVHNDLLWIGAKAKQVRKDQELYVRIAFCTRKSRQSIAKKPASLSIPTSQSIFKDSAFSFSLCK
jgi:hypothetical protein